MRGRKRRRERTREEEREKKRKGGKNDAVWKRKMSSSSWGLGARRNRRRF